MKAFLCACVVGFGILHLSQVQHCSNGHYARLIAVDSLNCQHASIGDLSAACTADCAADNARRVGSAVTGSSDGMAQLRKGYIDWDAKGFPCRLTNRVCLITTGPEAVQPAVDRDARHFAHHHPLQLSKQVAGPAVMLPGYHDKSVFSMCL